MQGLCKLTLGPLYPLSLLRIPTCFLTTQSPGLGTNSFPDEPTSAYYDDLINAAGRNQDFATVHHLLNKRVRDVCFNTTRTFNFISTDLSLLDGLLPYLARLDKGFCQRNAYEMLIARLSKLHRTDEALRVVNMMLLAGCGATANTFHPLLNVLTKSRKMEEAWGIMELMRENKITPDVTAYNYLLTAYCFVGDLKSAAEVLKKIGQEGMEADTRSYDALVLGACRTGKLEGALMVLRRMVDDGVSVLYSTHAHVIGALVKMGFYSQAVEFVVSYGGKDKALDTENFGLLASRLINLNRFDEAKFILEEMNLRGLAMGDKLKDFYELHVAN